MFSVHAAFVVTAVAYFAVSISGFWAFGTAVPSNVLDAISQPDGAITAAHLAVVLHVLASYQVRTGRLHTTLSPSDLPAVVVLH